MKEIIYSLIYAWNTKNTWWYTATARTKARFARTTLGGFWLGLSNILYIALLSTVYGAVFKVDNFNNYVVYLGVGLVAWNSIASSFLSAPTLFEANSQKLLNTNTKHIFYPLEEWAFQIQTFFQSLFLVLIALSFYQSNLFLNLIKVGFLPLINLLLLMFWLPIFISIIGLRYKDFFQLVPIIVQLIFLLSPFLYEKKTLGSISWIADFNPIYQVVNSFRSSIISGELSILLYISITIFNILGMLFSLFILNKSKKILPFLV